MSGVFDMRFRCFWIFRCFFFSGFRDPRPEIRDLRGLRPEMLDVLDVSGPSLRICLML